MRGSCAIDATFLEETHLTRERHCTIDLNPHITLFNIGYKIRQLFVVAKAHLGLYEEYSKSTRNIESRPLYLNPHSKI